MSALEIYVLSVGQGDTAIIKTPGNKVIVIDACKPPKVRDALHSICPDQTISHLIITHPHSDHYRAVPRLLADYEVQKVILAPFWFGEGTTAYHTLINRFHQNQIPLRFVGGYERIYPDAGTFPHYEGQVYLEVLGPPNDILEMLKKHDELEPNHLSIIVRLNYEPFSMVFAADAQVENWTHYDREGMLAGKCDVLKAAHHGSKRGSQWETLEKLSPRLVIVSSDPAASHELPDLIGSAIFFEYRRLANRPVALTRKTGTIKISVSTPGSSQFDAVCYRDEPDDLISSRSTESLPETDWRSVVEGKIPA